MRDMNELTGKMLGMQKEDTMDHLNIDRFLKVWAEILSDHYGVDIKFIAKRKEEAA